MKKAAQIIKEKPKEPVKDDKKGNESPLKRRVTLMPPKTKGSNQLQRAKTKGPEQLGSAQAKKESDNE